MSLESVRYTLTIEGQPRFVVQHLQLDERIDALYCATVHAVSTHDGAAEALLGASARLTLERDGNERRCCGIVAAAQSERSAAGACSWVLEVVPAATTLQHSSQARLFQEQSALQVAQEVLKAGLEPYHRTLRVTAANDYPPCDCLVQHDESDWQFVCRILAQDGIRMFFDHSGEAEELVLADCAAQAPELPQAVPVAQGQGATTEAIEEFTVRRGVATNAVRASHFDWTRPREVLQGEAEGESSGVVLQQQQTSAALARGYSDRAYTTNVAQQRATVALQREAMASWQHTGGQSTVCGLTPGYIVEISDPHQPSRSGRYLITAVHHSGHGHTPEVAHDAAAEAYHNEFSCLPEAVAYQPTAVGPPPRPLGLQTALVVGPEGEEIFTDCHGRVQVQFHWAPPDQAIWVRVAQAWAGAAFGSVSIPRVGMEVVVGFLGDDASQPLILGCAYNGANAPPSELPARKTQTSLHTRSTPGGEGHNALIFEDAKGSEEITVRAERDMTAWVGGDMSHTVVGNRRLQIDGACNRAIKGDQELEVEGASTHHILGTLATQVDGDATHLVGSNQTIDIQDNLHLTVGGDHDAEVQGHSTLTLKGNRSAEIGGNVVVHVSGDVEGDLKKSVRIVADSIEIEAKESWTLVQGKARIELRDGNIAIYGADVAVHGKSALTVGSDGNAVVKGKKVALN